MRCSGSRGGPPKIGVTFEVDCLEEVAHPERFERPTLRFVVWENMPDFLHVRTINPVTSANRLLPQASCYDPLKLYAAVPRWVSDRTFVLSDGVKKLTRPSKGSGRETQ